VTKQFDFDKPTDRQGTHAIKWDKYSADVIPLWVADMDFEAAPVIIDALKERIGHGVYGYTKADADWAQVIVDYYQREHNWAIQAEWIVWVPGVVASMNLACLALSPAHQTVITPEVIYPHFHAAPNNSNKKAYYQPMSNTQQRLRVDLDRLDESPTDDAKVMLFCNPQNPGGCVYSAAELNKIEAFRAQHNLIMVSDEIHADLILDQHKQHIPYGRISAEAENNSIILGAASKTYNVAGLACSWAIIANDGIRSTFQKAMHGIVSEINPLGYEATVTALEKGGPWRAELLDYLRGNRDYLAQEFASIAGIDMLPLEATFLAWLDVSALGLDDAPAFFEAAGVGMSPGAGFNDKNYMRLNFGCQRSVLEEAIKRIRKAVAAR